MLGNPVIITTPASMRLFLSNPTQSLGIITASSILHIMKKCPKLNFGPVLFIADPTQTEIAGDELRSQVIWNGSSAGETIDRLHTELATANN